MQLARTSMLRTAGANAGITTSRSNGNMSVNNNASVAPDGAGGLTAWEAG